MSMILKNDFYTVIEETTTEQGRNYLIRLNGEHPVYQAHFPGYPVTPGVCIAQIIKELSSVYLEQTFFLRIMRNVKFLNVLNPLKHPEVAIELSVKTENGAVNPDNIPTDDDKYIVSAIVRQGDVIFSKATLHLEAIGQVGKPALQERFDKLRLCVVIPTYNHSEALGGVLRDVLQYTDSLIVVNDGSTDDTDEVLKTFEGNVDIVSYPKNKGKGYALKCGFDRAYALGYRSAITMDSDGQHFASDLEIFVRLAEKYPDVFLVGQRTAEGDMPAKNSFANRFSNFWFTVQTGRRLRDTQNGFRLYPPAIVEKLRPFTSRYEAELELLVRAAWKNIPVCPAPVRVFYAADKKRITHFRPGMDFFRISLLNTLFFFLAIFYGYPSMLYHKLLKT